MAIVINGSGTVTGISVGGLPDDIVDAGTLADNAVGLAQMAGGTDGNIITYDTSGNPAVVATGSDGQILTSAGADAVPAFEAAPGGGKILQESTEGISTADSNTNSSWQTFAFISPTLTPATTSSKVLILVNIARASPGGNIIYFDLRREISGGASTDNISGESSGLTYNNNSGTAQGTYYSFIDSPSTTSAVTYRINWRNGDGSALTILGDDNALSTISLFEIGA